MRLLQNPPPDPRALLDSELAPSHLKKTVRRTGVRSGRCALRGLDTTPRDSFWAAGLPRRQQEQAAVPTETLGRFDPRYSSKTVLAVRRELRSEHSRHSATRPSYLQSRAYDEVRASGCELIQV